jgi:hypothetical protein
MQSAAGAEIVEGMICEVQKLGFWSCSGLGHEIEGDFESPTEKTRKWLGWE